MRVAILSHNAQHSDAIGNQVAEKLAFFLDRGADVRVFLESDRNLHPTVRPHVQLVHASTLAAEILDYLHGCDLVVVEFGLFYPLLTLLPLLAGGRSRILLDYHSVTPAECWGAAGREVLDQGTRYRGVAWCAGA